MGHIRSLIVFDLDGTLIDSRRDLATTANALIAERGGRPLAEEAIVKMVGDGAAMLVRRAFTAAGVTFGDNSVERFVELYGERLLETTRPYAGIPAALRQLAGDHHIAVLTNKPLAPTIRLLDAFGLSPLVNETLGGDGPHPRKPDPSALRQLSARFGVGGRQTVMVGDSRVDWATARAAGTRICLVRYGFGFDGLPMGELAGDEAIVDTPDEIPQAVERLLHEAGPDR